MFQIERHDSPQSMVEKKFSDLAQIWKITNYCGGASVYWIEPLTLDQRVVGLIPVNAWHFCPWARHFIHIAALHPGVWWVPGRKRMLFVARCGICAPPLKGRLARMLPRELRRCRIDIESVTGVIIHCKALWVVSHTWKALYKNQLLFLLLKYKMRKKIPAI